MHTNYPYHIILASASPRRKELLTQLGFEFTVEVKSVNEQIAAEVSPSEMAMLISQKKMSAFDMSQYPENTLIITADTVVAIDNMILGKPSDKEDARQMLRLLSSKQHEVITAVCFKTATYEASFFDKTVVEFSEINNHEIEYYIDLFKPFDKAGSYGIQEWIGHSFIKSITGSYTNVVGFPTELVRRELIKLSSNKTQ